MNQQPIHPEVKPRKRFDQNFKAEAVALWLKSGRSAQSMAAELGLRDKQLYRWKSIFAPGPIVAVKPTAADLEAEVAALRSENELLRQQRDILKKTLGILSEPPNNATNGLKR
jgi:transposase